MLAKASNRCPACSSVWLIAVNFIYFIFGIIFIALSAWGISKSNSSALAAAIPSGALVVLVIVGVSLIILAIVGWLGVRFNYNITGRVVLGVYATILIILMIMEFAAAGVLLTFTGQLDDYSVALQVKDNGINYFVNQTYTTCCANGARVTNGSCWIPPTTLYICDSQQDFATWLSEYIGDRIIPVAAIALVIGFLQFFTAVAACCNQCKGRKTEEQKKIGGPLSYDGLYAEGEEAYSGYGYEAYVKSGQPRAASAAGGATAPRVGSAAAAAAAPKGGKAPAK